MKCGHCGSTMTSHATDLPFKVGDTSIVVVRGVPVLECVNCHDYLIAHADMKRVEAILERGRPGAELEVTRFAA